MDGVVVTIKIQVFIHVHFQDAVQNGLEDGRQYGVWQQLLEQRVKFLDKLLDEAVQAISLLVYICQGDNSVAVIVALNSVRFVWTIENGDRFIDVGLKHHLHPDISSLVWTQPSEA